MPRIVLAGGGSAGHIEPALAVADALVQLDSNIQPEILGTPSGLETRLVPSRGYHLRTISKVVMPRKLDFVGLLFPVRILQTVLQARNEIKGAIALVGFGGYVSAAAYLAAFTLRIPITMHEANSKPGWANRMGRHLAAKVAVNFASLGRKWRGSIVTGMPIRKSIIELTRMERGEFDSIRSNLASEFGFNPKLPLIVIFGGSLGSQRINDAVASAIESGVGDIQILHALGSANPLPKARPGYFPVPYLEDMSKVYASADLVICRSGAVTCAELSAAGKFAVLVPLAHGNGEQIDNADELVSQGIAIRVPDSEFDGEWLITNLRSTLERAREIGDLRSDASIQSAEEIARITLSTVRSSGN